MKLRILTLLLVLPALISLGQTTVIEGHVTDSITGKGIVFVKVKHQYSGIGAFTDTSGFYSIKTNQPSDTLEFICIGYKTVKRALIPGQKQVIDVQLSPAAKNLTEVVVEAGDNPAWRILDSVRAHRSENDPENKTAYQCEVYNKLQFDVNNMSEKFQDRKVFENFDFIMDYMDSVNGENYLPVLLTESISDYYFRSPPAQRHEVIKATRITGVDYLQLGQFTGDMYQNVNLYSNYMDLFARDFMSPVAEGAKLFYKHYLQDNDTIDGEVFYHIKFTPRRSGEALFEGEFWVHQPTFAITRIIAKIPADINLNYVSGFYVEQTCEQVEPGVWMMTNEKMLANFDLFNEADDSRLMGATVHKNTTRRYFVFDQPKELDFYLMDVQILDSAANRDDVYWEAARHTDLNEEEQGVIEMVDSLKENRTYKFYENLTYFSYTGFWRWKKIEIGNLYSIYNRNVVEGDRLMLSLRTSNRFSKKVEISTFGIYGFGDKQYKYGASVRWKISNAPREMLRFAYKKRIEQLGLASSIGDIGNSFTTLFSAGPLDKLTMVDQGSISFEKDYKIDMRTFHAVEWKHFTPLGSSDYSRIDPFGDTLKITGLTSFEIRNQIMYTREEKFLAGQFDRYSLGSRKPIVSLTHTWGIKGVLGSQYNFHRLDFAWDHRPKIGFLGKLHYTVYAGKIFGTVPYPFLEVHQGNETYYLQITTMNLMNYYEFISDEWVGINFEHYLMGLITDRIPLIKKLELRIVYSAKMVIGRYNPKHNAEMLLPYYSHKFSYPYYEVSAGFENIFKFIRVDAIWRLSYRDHVNLYGEPIKNFGVKFTFSADF
ncbi:MAG: carboxypeptidase-like regulatory domain-containing protein [Bacteroidetes bacterium]|nr:carboxypeptidase-like regulatory domain-containing protein [Bacteroidota bacterium]